jgi:SPP1 family predicted phage head-tail adaptor
MDAVINAGDLRHKIQLVRQTSSQGTSGGIASDQGDVYAEPWAKIEALAGRELMAAQQRVSEVTHRITIRWMPDVRSSDMVWFGTLKDGAPDRQFDIEAVMDPDERCVVLWLLCVERDDSARAEGGAAS